jgi:hypothetical protein
MKTIFTILMLLLVTLVYSQQIENEMMDVDPPAPKSGAFDNFFKDYTWGKQKFISDGLLALACFNRGFNFGYEVDGRTFFDKRGYDPYGFYGSESWRYIYNNKNDASQGYVKSIYAHTGAIDFQHVADASEKYLMISAGISIGICGNTYNHKWQHWVADLARGLIIGSLAERAGYKLARGQSFF